MNATTIEQLAVATVTGSLPFQEIVGRLIEHGVEYYVVDYRTLQFRFYGAQGGVVEAPLAIEGLPSVQETFDLAGLRAAILDSQAQGQKFRDFSRRAMSAGVQSYYAFLRGQRVTYLGRQGDQHVEWFPGAAPTDS
jgi:uncharacterized protein YbcV (DUF1398 family)